MDHHHHRYMDLTTTTNTTTTTNDNNNVNTSSTTPPFSSTAQPIPIQTITATTHIPNPTKKRTKFMSVHNADHATATTSKPKPTTEKPSPTAPKITRPCTECGKKFWSWKALFGHMRCHPERQWRGINPPPHFRRPEINDGSTEEDQEIADCLLLLANGPEKVDVSDHSMSITTVLIPNQGPSALEYCDSTRDVDMGVLQPHDVVGTSGLSGRFECSSCKKVFGSHQALGGHRASHKNVKGCYANTRSVDSQGLMEGTWSGDGGGELGLGLGLDVDVIMELDHSSNSCGHKCSLCTRVFASGQALGGHMRCHWEKAGEEEVRPMSLGQVGAPTACGLDLNLPTAASVAPVERDVEDASFSYSLDLRLTL